MLAVVRVDNEKTAVARGAGTWGKINEAYRRYAQTLRFHIDACAPRSPEAKGKVERSIRECAVSPVSRWDGDSNPVGETPENPLSSRAGRGV